MAQTICITFIEKLRRRNYPCCMGWSPCCISVPR